VLPRAGLRQFWSRGASPLQTVRLPHDDRATGDMS
jgi:hypothetical protein